MNANGHTIYRTTKTNLTSPFTPKLNESAIKLRQERNAWAFALNKLRPFIERDLRNKEQVEEQEENPLEPILGTKYNFNFNESSVLSAINNYYLQGYENELSKQARTDLLTRAISFFKNLKR